MISLERLILLFLLAISANSFAQNLPVLKSKRTRLDIRDGNELRKGRWNIDPKTKPDIFKSVVNNKHKWVTFISDTDSIRFKVKADRKYQFLVVLNEKDTALTQIEGIKAVPYAQFNKRYVKSHDHKSFVEVPQVYELFNIIVALTSSGKKDDGLVFKDTKYHQDLLAWFDKYRDEQIVKRIDSVLSHNLMTFVALKMDSYAFELAPNGKIKKSKVYNRISSGLVNTLDPYLSDLQVFSDNAKFPEFYQHSIPFYDAQIETYRDSIGLQEMQRWLTKNFPTTSYNSVKVIFSPLVGNIQSATWFENNGFKEAQAHVNFPYPDKIEEQQFSPNARNVRKGNIVFTELNHCFINPEGEKPQYKTSLAHAFSDLAIWNEKGKPAAQYYNNPYSCFNEYVNWALVSLRYLDYAPADEQDKLITSIEKRQVNIRGFKEFSAFNQYLLKIYKQRSNGQTVSDLYPLIVKWFEDHK